MQGKNKERQDTGKGSQPHATPMAAPFKPQRPQKQGLGGQGYLLPHTSLLHRRARESLLALCKRHNAASSYSSQPMDTQHGAPTGALSAWKWRWEHERPSVWVLQSSNRDAGKQQQKPTSSLLQEGTPNVHAELSISCEPGLCKAVQDASGFWKMKGNVTTLVLTEAGERERYEPHISGSASQGAQRSSSGEQPHPAHPEPGEPHANTMLALKLQAARGRNKSKTKHLSKSPFPVVRTVMQYFQTHALCGSGGQFHALTPA